MAHYLCGPSLLRLPGKEDDPVQPGDLFDHDFPPDHEAALLEGGAISLVEDVATASDNHADVEVSADETASVDADDDDGSAPHGADDHARSL